VQVLCAGIRRTSGERPLSAPCGGFPRCSAWLRQDGGVERELDRSSRGASCARRRICRVRDTMAGPAANCDAARGTNKKICQNKTRSLAGPHTLPKPRSTAILCSWLGSPNLRQHQSLSRC
jgi:hypothetical protein